MLLSLLFIVLVVALLGRQLDGISAVVFAGILVTSVMIWLRARTGPGPLPISALRDRPASVTRSSATGTYGRHGSSGMVLKDLTANFSLHSILGFRARYRFTAENLGEPPRV